MKINLSKCVVALFFVFVCSSIEAQVQVQEGVLRIKLNEQKAAYMKTATISKSAQGYTAVGDAILDAALAKCKASGMTRVFKPAGAFEAKHEKYGLHLWYEITFDPSIPVSKAILPFKENVDILITEPVYEKKNIDEDIKELETGKGALTGPTNDTFYDYQWHYENTGSNLGNGGGGTTDADIDLPEAWAIQTGTPNVVVAVIDGGIDVDHEDLAANMWVNTDEVPGNGVDDDGNGYVDDVYGYNFGDNTGAINEGSHGTHVGGTVAAVTNNGVGVAGVAGGNGSGDGIRLMSCATFGAVGVDGFDAAFIYAADNGAVIAQNSWGYISPGFFEQSVLDAIDYFIAEAGYDASGNPIGPMQGGMVIFAAGNDGVDDDWYPAIYPPVMAVGSTDLNDNVASYSNRGNWVDIAAPGSDVVSTTPGNSYGYNTGTSMACPHVSGVAALLVSENAGNITPAQVWSLLVDNADPLPVSFVGSGRLNAFASLDAASSGGPGPVFPDPTKTYYIDNPQWNVRLGANGAEDAFTTAIGTTGNNVEWTITPSPTAGYYYIDCVGGGSAPRIRSDQSQFADMQSTAAGGTWTRWMFTDAGNGEYYLTTVNNSDFMRLRVNSSAQVETVAANFTGSWTHFLFTEAGAATSSFSGEDLVMPSEIYASAAASSPDVSEPVLVSEVNVYPVPVAETLNLSIPAESAFTVAEIVDLSGKVIIRQSISSNTTYSFDVGKLSKGLHFVRLIGADENVALLKFLK
ncbi:MAG: S8 family serine peptidase [Bacteroidota bacterium]